MVRCLNRGVHYMYGVPLSPPYLPVPYLPSTANLKMPGHTRSKGARFVTIFAHFAAGRFC
jgi:hypothetical protein